MNNFEQDGNSELTASPLVTSHWPMTEAKLTRDRENPAGRAYRSDMVLYDIRIRMILEEKKLGRNKRLCPVSYNGVRQNQFVASPWNALWI